jgi:hypothetical protein
MKSTVILHLKNLIGTKCQRKLVAICLDDYGNVRLHSRDALAELERQRLPRRIHFDEFDALETSKDLESMFEVLSSVKDSKGNNARLTALANVANADFAKMKADGFENYSYEMLPTTYGKLGNEYQNCMELWRQGIDRHLIRPEFHGREHLNLRILMAKLKNRNHDVLTCFSQNSLARLTEPTGSHSSWTAAFEFNEKKELSEHCEIIADGINCFERVFARRPGVFNSPGGKEHPSLHPFLKQQGFRIVERSFFHWAHQGKGRFRPSFARARAETKLKPAISIRNCVFEPTAPAHIDWVAKTLQQIEIAFYWNRPAIISCHRVNFVGKICEKNRQTGLSALRSLLAAIVARWPDVEFQFLDELCDRMGLLSTSASQ